MKNYANKGKNDHNRQTVGPYGCSRVDAQWSYEYKESSPKI